MPFPIKVCVICSEEFELRPDKPGYANRCPACSETESEPTGKDAAPIDRERDAERRKAIKNMLYRKDG